MVVKNQIKFIKSLQQKKYRIHHQLFVAEGIKLVNELLNSTLSVAFLYATEDVEFEMQGSEPQIVSEKTLSRMSGLKSPNKTLGVFKIPEPGALDFKDWILALDRIQDPGNLGTIIRLCDWFGIRHLLCTPDTVDCYNPKTLQATMGSIARVNIVYRELEDIIESEELSVYGAFMEGDSVYQHSFPKNGILLMGNESHGISDRHFKLIDQRISIPQYGTSDIESLNVATATAILLNEIRRPPIQK